MQWPINGDDMKLIKTTKKMRGLYDKHLNKFYAHVEDGEKFDENCYMCEADNEKFSDCDSCPLNLPYNKDRDWLGCVDARRLNLRTLKGNPTMEYKRASPESILKHARWIEQQITEKTDCEFETIKPRRK